MKGSVEEASGSNAVERKGVEWRGFKWSGVPYRKEYSKIGKGRAGYSIVG